MNQVKNKNQVGNFELPFVQKLKIFNNSYPFGLEFHKSTYLHNHYLSLVHLIYLFCYYKMSLANW